jgi:hypothetical protein
MRREMRFDGVGVRLVAALALAPALGCGDGSKNTGTPVPSRTFRNFYQGDLTRKLDVLFMVDNSSSIAKAQEALRAGIPRFVAALSALEGGLPDLHVAVVSSDMGVGHNDIPNCNATSGDNGRFRSGVGTGAIGCTATGLQAGATFVNTTGGANPQTNFTGDLVQVLQCILPIGASGCGFQQPLRSMVRALGADGVNPPAENGAFLRPEANLGIVLLTNEDDCSATNNGFYDVLSNTNLASALGPAGNFRCSEFGHLCGGSPPARLAPNGMVTDTISYQNCVSAEDRGQLIGVADFAAAVKSLKVDPAGQITVATIQGPTAPYQIHWKTPSVTTDGPWPEITHSCTAPNGGFADPGVRMQQFAQEFGGNGLVYSICEADYGPALSTIATKMAQQFRADCVVGTLVDRDRDPSNGVQPDCAVFDQVPNGAGTGTVDSTVPACADNGNAPPCYVLRAPIAMENCPANSNVIRIDRGGITPPANIRFMVECSICIPGVPDPEGGCP